jgi:hypothetical protein
VHQHDMLSVFRKQGRLRVKRIREHCPPTRQPLCRSSWGESNRSRSTCRACSP